jgi:hypothetical protein
MLFPPIGILSGKRELTCGIAAMTESDKNAPLPMSAFVYSILL